MAEGVIVFFVCVFRKRCRRKRTSPNLATMVKFFSMLVQVGLRFLEQVGTSAVGSFERRLAEVPFELLTGVIDTAFDLIEFVKAGIEREQEVKSADGGIACFGGSHFALEGKGNIAIADGHRKFWVGNEKQGMITISPFSRYPNLPKLHTTTWTRRNFSSESLGSLFLPF
jgi:hypothetical protein